MAYDKDTIYFSLPDFYHNFNLNMIMVKMMNDYPGWFRDNVKVDSFYGTFPGCIWNSGRGQFGQANRENIEKTIVAINQAGISIRFTFTNGLLSPRHFKDYYGNTILEIGSTGMNGVNVSSDLFEDYIKTNYPDYYLIWSTTKGAKTVEEIDELSAVHLTVPPYTMNNTDAVFKFKHPENIELLCCEACIDNCPNRATHYTDISKGQLLLSTKGYVCPHGCERYYYYDTVPTRKHHITIDDMINTYLPAGINKFKISGRNDNIINGIERYVEYLPKPEYKDQVRNHLLLDTIN